MESIRTVNPAAPYLGGKRRLANRVINRLTEIPHDCYVEPFIGMGGVFLRRPWRSKTEVINDINRDVAMKWQITSRAEFERLVAAVPDTLTGGARFDITKLASILEDIHERLAGVVIECLPFERLILNYDRPETLFYLDPPYWGCETDYGPDVFAASDFKLIASTLSSIKRRFLLSLNDTPEVREIFQGFQMDMVETQYSVNGAQQASAAELLISDGRAGAGSLFAQPSRPAYR